MIKRSSWILLFCLCAASASASGQDPLVGGIEGRIIWEGDPFPAREVLWPPGIRNQDIVLERILVDRKIMDESLLVDPKSKGIKDCLVLLPDFQLPSRPPGEVGLTIEGLSPNPRILSVPKNSQLKIVNKDPIPYVFLTTDEKGQVKRFEVDAKSEQSLKLPAGDLLEFVEERFSFLRVNIHRVGDLPAMVSGVEGTFAIRGIKAPEVLLTFEHPVLGRGQRRVKVLEGETTKVTITQNDFVGPEASLRGSPFSGTENPQFRIEGLVVPQADFQAVVDFLESRHHRFGLPRSLLESHSLKQVLVPVAATYVHFQKEVPRLEEKAQEFRSALAKGETFAEVARRMTEKPETHTFGPVSRRDIDPWLGLGLFSSPRKIVIGPIWSARGLHFFYVEDVQGQGAEELRSGYQVFFNWERERPRWRLSELLQALRDRARVLAINPQRAALVQAIQGR